MTTATKTIPKAEAKKKRALPFKRRSTFLAYPEQLHLEKREGHRHYDPRVHYPYVEAKVKWIMIHGVQQDVMVEKCGDLVVVVDGRQRVINALEANRRLVKKGLAPRMIPVAHKRGDALSLFQIGVIVNEHRQAENPVTQALKMAAYLNLGMNEDDCAELWGVDPRTVKNRLYLLELCPEVQKAVIEGSVTVTRALTLRNKSFEDQVKALTAAPPPKVRRPTKRVLKRVLSEDSKLPKQVRAVLEWREGLISDEEVCEHVKSLGRILGPDSKDDPAQGRLFS